MSGTAGSMSYLIASQSLQMSPEVISLIIAIVSIVVSWVGAAFIAGSRWATVTTRLEIMERSVQTMATKEQLAGLKEDVAEIKGMFRMVPRTDSDGK